MFAKQTTELGITKFCGWSLSHRGDTTLPISVEIITKIQLLDLTLFSSKINCCPIVNPVQSSGIALSLILPAAVALEIVLP